MVDLMGDSAMQLAAKDGSADQPLEQVPVTLLTGFLGAGKTTRLNATLAAGTSRIAVIENELGALGVDGAMVANRHDDGVVELTNGCLCCSAEVDLISALEALAHRRATRPFDRLIIETTGLADVGPVIAFLRDPEDELAEDFVFDGVVTVVDGPGCAQWAANPASGPPMARASGFGGGTLAATEESSFAAFTPGVGRENARNVFWKQVGLADQLIVSKADLIDEVALNDLLATLAVVNPVAEIIVDRSRPPAALPAPMIEGDRKLQIPRPPVPVFRPISTKRRRAEPHLDGVQALSVRQPCGRPLQGALLKRLAEELLQQSVGPSPDGPGDVWRIKGFVIVEGEGPMLLQGVGDQVTLERWPHDLKGAQPFLVVIGERLQQELLNEALMACTSDVEQQQLS